jgi:response regulator RpfG family c-di-GMP phosphodiesterase
LSVKEILESIKLDQKVTESILVVDDESNILQLVKEMLVDQDYDILLAESLVKADKILKEKEISLVLTDLILGDGSGVDVLLHTQKHHPDAKIILMTGKPTIQNAISVLKKGAFDYLVKPFNMEHLKATIKRAVNQQKLERENIRLNEIMSFYKISEAMGSVIELDRLLNLILDTAIREFSADFAGLHLIQPDGGISHQKNVCKDPDESDYLSNFSQKLAKEISFKGKPVIIKEQDAYARTGQKIIKSSICQPLLAKGKTIGILSLLGTKTIHQYTTGQLTTLSLFAAKAAMAIENSKLYKDLEDAYFNTVETLANAIEARDKYTAGHTNRVCKIAFGIAKILDWKPEIIKKLKIGAILHDIGKIGVPDAILNKHGPLTSEEFTIMKSHPEVGAHMIEKVDFLEPALPYILYHHERYDGKGYPMGLKGEDIPIEGRILAVVDTFDAIISDRPYRKGRNIETAIKEIKDNSGTQFDPVIVEAFLKTIDSIDLDPLYIKNPLLIKK